MGEGNTHVLDAVITLTSSLGRTDKPVFFQRDDRFCVLAGDAVGMVSGLPWHRTVRDPQTYEFLPPVALKNTTDAFDSDNRKVRKLRAEDAPYINPLLFSDEDDSVTLDNLRELAGKLVELPDDGNVRLVDQDHGSRRVGSCHTAGYVLAMSVTHARVMPRTPYFGLLRAREDEAVCAIDGFQPDVTGNLKGDYNRFVSERLPFFVMTPDVLIVGPLNGRMECDRRGLRPSSWSPKTRFSGTVYESSSLWEPYKVETSARSPFKLSVLVNAQSYDGAGGCAAAANKTHVVSEQLARAAQCLGPIHDYVARLNAAHDRRFERKIAEHESYG